MNVTKKSIHHAHAGQITINHHHTMQTTSGKMMTDVQKCSSVRLPAKSEPRLSNLQAGTLLLLLRHLIRSSSNSAISVSRFDTISIISLIMLPSSSISSFDLGSSTLK